MQRKFDYKPFLSDALVDHPVMRRLSVGIPGIDVAVCEALCEAVSLDDNITNSENCRAFAHKRDDPFSLTDRKGRCFLLRNSGACKPEDFGAALFTRLIESEEICHAARPGFADPLCIGLPTTRYDTRVLTHADATAISAQTPRDAAPGSGGLPHPRNMLEAGFIVALARQDRIYSFWAASPDATSGDVTMHWFTEGRTRLVYKHGEFRCILVSSITSSTASKMYASLEPCDAKMASGIITIAAAAAPPPPPGTTRLRTFFDPQRAPPPPPSMKRHALTIWKRNVILPLTEAVCDGNIGEGHTHRKICSAFLDQVGKFQHIHAYGTDAPLCRPWCWHACDGAHEAGQEHDSWTNCQSPECAAYSCLGFLLKECQPIQHSSINTQWRTTCTIVPPSPPNLVPPSPPSPPLAPLPLPPPPILEYAERFKARELDSDPDCNLVAYSLCQEIIRQFANARSGYSVNMRVTTSECEATDVETDCFVGCAYGDRTGGTYRFLPDGTTSNAHTRPRCKMSIHPRCACSNHASPPPYLFAPPPPVRFTEEWKITNIPNVDASGKPRETSLGATGALSQRLVNGRTLDISLRSGPMHAFACPRDDDGRDTCALTCANQHLGRLRAFTVTGEKCVFDVLNPHSPTFVPCSDVF